MDLRHLLLQHFGHKDFRPVQEEIVQSVLHGHDTLALLPTGGGKSICYQLPTLASGGLCLVVTPLIALMKDQVQQLRRRNIPALAVHSGMTFFEVKKALVNACSGEFRFLYLSPERLQTRLFREYLPGMPVTLVAVDEAHCISQWGYDFRPPYLRIAELREELPGVPVLALTASATPTVQRDITEKLGFGNGAQIFRQSFERTNLSFSVFDEAHKANKLINILKKVPGSALVYCRNRKRCKEVAALLKMHGISSGYYHAGLSTEERNNRQDEWIQNKCRVMVCTNAFGMGIDKAAVRTVVHIDVPDSLEAYYQEAGRAGRDGKRAFAVLLQNEQDLEVLNSLPAEKFPPLEKVKKVYEAICNHLQIPVGAGEQSYFNFDLGIFCEKFKLAPVLVVHALQMLSQAGYLSFNEQVFLPASVKFVARRQYIEQVEADKPALEPLIKTLLRTYEGILDEAVSISEKLLASVMQLELATVIQQLQQLVVCQVIEYHPRKDTPQVFMQYDRVPVDQLHFDETLYRHRKNQYEQQVKMIQAYAEMNSGCRSIFIRNYFGDAEAKPCGICDHCLEQKRKPFSDVQVQLAEASLLHQLQRPMTSLQLRRLCLEVEARLFDFAFQRLLEEEKIIQLKDGTFHQPTVS